jgi:hypothetical protein
MVAEAFNVASKCLSAKHATILLRIGVSEELVTASGIRSIAHAEAREFGFQLSAAADLSGIVFPYHDPISGQRVTSRLRRDHPDMDSSGKFKGKYVSPFGDQRHLYFPPGAAPSLSDTSVPVFLVEAEKSALALTALASRVGRRLLAVATGGCWGWRGKIGIEPAADGSREEIRGALPDLDRIDWGGGREAVICFDANCKTNLKAQSARRSLTEELLARCASVKIAVVPQQEGVNGPDDLIAICGDGAAWAVLDSAEPVGEAALAEAESAIALLEADQKQFQFALEAVAGVSDSFRRTLLVGRMADLRIPGLTKTTATEQVGLCVKQSEAKRAEAQTQARKGRLLRLPVTPAQLIADLETYYSRRRHLPEGTALAEALFCLNTYVFDVFDTTPYLLYESATGGCGKTTALEFHEAICARAYLGVDPTAAVLFRRIDRDRPTWLLDEARVLQTRGDRGQEILALFDAGYKAGATVSRAEDHGKELHDFTVYCPKVLAKIGGFKGTLLDRGIVIHLEKAPGLPQTRRRILAKEAAPLKDALDAYALQYRAVLERLYADEPDTTYWPALSGRESEIWGPLLTHARLAGPEIEMRALEMALRFSGRKAEIAVVEDLNLGLAAEALEVLEALEGNSFLPSALFRDLSGKEIWGERLEDRKSDKAKVSTIGRFFKQFRLQGRHTAAGTQYGRGEAIDALRRHVPGAQQPGSVNVSASQTTLKKSGDCTPDTCSKQVSAEVSVAESLEPAGVLATADTLTAQYAVEETL